MRYVYALLLFQSYFVFRFAFFFSLFALLLLFFFVVVAFMHDEHIHTRHAQHPYEYEAVPVHSQCVCGVRPFESDWNFFE